MKKHELIAENKRLKLELEQSESSRLYDQDSNDRKLIRLGLIPDRYIRRPEVFRVMDGADPIIDWYQIGRDLKDLETYEAAERGRKIAGVGETTIEVNLDTSGFQEALKKFVERGRRIWPEETGGHDD